MSKYPFLSEKKCQNCQSNILIKRSRDYNNRFCSSSCVGKFRKINEYVNCKYCDTLFLKSSKTKNIFCSKSCSNKSRIKEYIRICESCGARFIIHNIAEISRGGGRFCSHSCASRKYSLNQDYFKEINTEEKAYILGFIYADGCVSKKGYELIIKLNNKDRILLEKIRNEMDSNQPINYVKNKNQSILRISSKKICLDLLNNGVMPAKTFKIEFPSLNLNLVRHFIRGYFDGDGCITKIKNRNSFNIVIFTASENFMSKMVNILDKYGIKNGVYKRDSGYAIQFSKKDSVIKFGKLIYEDSNIYLERKKEKFPV